MTRLTGLLPVAQGVAAYAALVRAADSCLARGDTRGRGQIMADTLVERITGQRVAADVPIEVNVVLGVDTLLGADDEPADIAGYGPIPAPLARRMVAGPERDAPVWVRRLFTRPVDGALVQLETRRRRFTAGQARLVRLRDQVCRTPWCGAPIRHIDHVRGVAHGGVTALDNAQGLCVACNHAKQAPGWRAGSGPLGSTVTVTPTGHRYLGHPPRPPCPPGGSDRPRPRRPDDPDRPLQQEGSEDEVRHASPVEIEVRELVRAG